MSDVSSIPPGDDGLPVVLFVCVHNAGRSQMALGWSPFGKTVDQVRPVRDEIGRRVSELLADLGVA